jgi:hypothetical protein
MTQDRRRSPAAESSESSSEFKTITAELGLAKVDEGFWSDRIKLLSRESSELHSGPASHESLDVKMLSIEVDALREVVRTIHRKRQMQTIDLNSPLRVEVLVSAM